MKEIKFRAWDKENNQFIMAQLFPRSEEPFMGKMEKGASIDIKHTSPKKLEWELFTGLKDKNGKEVYEGDIVKSSDGLDDYIDEVTISPINGVCFGKYRYAEMGLPDGFEIVGNIYQNPELLTKD